MSFLKRLPFPNCNSVSEDLYIVFKRFHLIFPVAPLESQVEARFMHFLSYLAFCIPHRIPHSISSFHHIAWSCRGWLYPCCLFVLLGRAERRVRYRGARWVRLWGSSQLWQLCRQDDHTLEITTIFAMLFCSLFCYANATMPTICLSASQLPCWTSNPPCPSKPLIGYVTALLSPLL